MKKLDLTILMPCLNEEESIEFCIKEAKTFLKNNSKINGEILIIDNGSSDNSVKIAKKNRARVVKESQKGYGNALKRGITEAKGKYIIMGDCDGSYDFLNLETFYEALANNYDLVVGNRFKGGIEKGAMPFGNKYIGNPILSFIARKIFPCNIYDFHCGLRGGKKEALLKLNLSDSGMEFASEMIVKAVKNDLNIIEKNTILRKSLRTRKSHLRPLRDSFRHLKTIFKNKFGSKYN